MNQNKHDIIRVLRDYQDFVNASDAEGLAALYHENAILIPDRMSLCEGVDAIRTFYKYAFSVLELNLEFTINPEQIVVDSGFAFATTHSTGTRLLKQEERTVPEINRELWVFEKASDTWGISRYCFNKAS
ncbi:MAG: DUF4440 domain-containing protein [Roseibium sp.]|uniref:YybH family protein n=1 Tax=Roseibium sp. TaxID=1936156 RepID=UPI003D9C1622